MGLHRERFKDQVIAELLPPHNKRGQSPLWEAIGRRFTNMDYWEADALCQKNKEFIFSLFPSGKIYTTFFPAEARNALGKVGKDTEPVVHMLKKIGFKYKNQVDPFDGGPHLWADIAELAPVKRIARYQFAPSAEVSSSATRESGILCPAHQEPGQFRAVAVQAVIEGDKLFVPEIKDARMQSVLGIGTGDRVVFMPYY
jgi:arginine N-succinyltransferase